MSVLVDSVEGGETTVLSFQTVHGSTELRTGAAMYGREAVVLFSMSKGGRSSYSMNMMDALESCPDCGSTRHKACKQRPELGILWWSKDGKQGEMQMATDEQLASFDVNRDNKGHIVRVRIKGENHA